MSRGTRWRPPWPVLLRDAARPLLAAGAWCAFVMIPGGVLILLGVKR